MSREPRFMEDGYQFFPKLFGGETIGRVRETVEEICRTVRPGGPFWDRIVPVSELKEHRNPGVAPGTVDPGVPFIIGGLPLFSEVLRAFILEEKLWAAAREVLETDEVVYHFSNVTRKPARIGPNLSWHRDYPNRYICPAESRHFFRALVPLEGMDRGNGCTELLPGTHRVSDETAAREERKRDFDLTGAIPPIPLEAEPGDMIALGPKIVHGGRENRSGRERNLAVIQFGVKAVPLLYDWKDEPCNGMSREEIAG